MGLILYVGPGSVVGLVVPGFPAHFSLRSLNDMVEESPVAVVVPGPQESISDFNFLGPLLMEMGFSMEGEVSLAI